VLVEIAPTSYCNANCPWCFFKGISVCKRIKSNVMLRVIREMHDYGVKAINWTGGGEPTLHPQFPQFVELAAGLGMKQGLFTNGLRVIPSQGAFEWIRISVTPRGIKHIKVPKVEFGICLNHTREHSYVTLEQMCQEARDIGARYFQIRPALEEPPQDQAHLPIPYELRHFSTPEFVVFVTDYKYEDAHKPREYDECFGYHFCPSIDWTGKLKVCLYRHDDHEYTLGDLNTDKFGDLMAQAPKDAVADDSCQQCCKLHELNKILYATKYAEQVEFL